MQVSSTRQAMDTLHLHSSSITLLRMLPLVVIQLIKVKV